MAFDEHALRHQVPRADLALLQTEASLPALPRVQPVDTLDQVMNNNQQQQAVVLASLQEAQVQAVRARKRRVASKVKRIHLQALAKRLQAKLAQALTRSAKLEASAKALGASSTQKISSVQRHTKQQQRAATISAALQHKYSKSRTRMSTAAERVAAIESQVQSDVKYKLQAAAQGAEQLLRRAKVAAAKMKADAAQSVQLEQKRAKQREAEITEDARSEMVSTRRKLKRVQQLVQTAKGLSNKAQGQALQLMSSRQQLRQTLLKAKKEVNHRQAQLQLVHTQLQALDA
eukprot:TRINITY_DN2009_c0_g1_i3.p1 TRINITY_DN2009_c0_g1~~TRINITY_DN2009_c0_g1_i3.p1  ORF type:complete len:289 (-),score=132.88 TRINITY_DN2009_c0_g1_i3:250-1116(-)